MRQPFMPTLAAVAATALLITCFGCTKTASRTVQQTPAPAVPAEPPTDTQQSIDALLQKLEKDCYDEKTEAAAFKAAGLTATDEVLTELVTRLIAAPDINAETDLRVILVFLGAPAETRLCSELKIQDDPFAKRKISWALTHFCSVNALQAMLPLLTDTRIAQKPSPLLEGEQMRLCDCTLGYILLLLEIRNQPAPAKSRGNMDQIADRDKQIAVFQAHWKTHGAEVLKALQSPAAGPTVTPAPPPPPTAP